MKVVDIMMRTAYQCRPETNLGSATEFMWRGNCGFLPVVGEEGRVIGVITDRDICVALGTRNRLAGDIRVSDVMSPKVYSCLPEDDIHIALRTMREGRVRRLPVLGKDGALAGVISIDDVLVHAEPVRFGKLPDLSSEDVVKAFQAINVRQVPQVVAKKAAAA
jgi:CBS domain-containing protein